MSTTPGRAPQALRLLRAAHLTNRRSRPWKWRWSRSCAPVARARDGRDQGLRDRAQVRRQRGPEGGVGEYRQQTEKHVQVLPDACLQLEIDPEEQTRGRKITHDMGPSLVAAMEAALGTGRQGAGPGVAPRCVVHAETVDHFNWQLIGEVAKRRTGARGEGAEGGLPGGRGRGGRAPTTTRKRLAARALAARPLGLKAQRAGPRRRRSESASPSAAGPVPRNDLDEKNRRPTPARRLTSSAASTARFAITVMRCARYSGEACRSLLRPSGFTLMFATASGANFARAPFPCRPGGTRIGPAPVTATRTLPAEVGHEHADDREARRRVLGTSRRPRFGAGNATEVMSSPARSAVSYRPLKNLSAAILRLLVLMVAPRPSTAAGIVGRRDRCWRASRRSCPCCAPGGRRSCRRARRAPGSPSSRPRAATSAWRVIAPISTPLARSP